MKQYSETLNQCNIKQCNVKTMEHLVVQYYNSAMFNSATTIFGITTSTKATNAT